MLIGEAGKGILAAVTCWLANVQDLQKQGTTQSKRFLFVFDTTLYCHGR